MLEKIKVKRMYDNFQKTFLICFQLASAFLMLKYHTIFFSWIENIPSIYPVREAVLLKLNK